MDRSDAERIIRALETFAAAGSAAWRRKTKDAYEEIMQASRTARFWGQATSHLY
jgi:hypothetical protein